MFRQDIYITGIEARPRTFIELKPEGEDDIREQGMAFYAYCPDIGEIPIPELLWRMLSELGRTIDALKPPPSKEIDNSFPNPAPGSPPPGSEQEEQDGNL